MALHTDGQNIGFEFSFLYHRFVSLFLCRQEVKVFGFFLHMTTISSSNLSVSY